MRIGINVPDDLLKQVKEIKPSVNVSQVCREALEQHVQVAARAAAQAARDGAARQVERLDQLVARPVIEPDWEAHALNDARAWVSTVTPEVWERFIYQADFLRRQGRDETEMVEIWSHGEGVEGLAGRLNESMEWFVWQCEHEIETGVSSGHLEKARSEYGRAWLGYVNEVRRLLERHRKEEYERVMAQRSEYRRSLPDPELPSQLV